MKKTALEAAALKHLSRWHKTNIEEELMKARAFTAALIALEESEATESDLRPFSLHNAERVGHLANNIGALANSIRRRLSSGLAVAF